MKVIVDVNTVRNNINQNIDSNLFNWIDIRNNFLNIGLDLVEDFLKIDNIGFVTNNIKDALRIRNVNKSIPIILLGIDNVDQVYDLIMNNIILGINDYSLLNDIKELNIKDNLSIFIQIDINNYEDGISIKNYKKFKESNNDSIKIVGLYSIINDKKNQISDLEELLEEERLNSFAIGIKSPIFTDGFLSYELLNGVIKYQVKVGKCIPLKKGDVFVNKKIKNDCYGIKIVNYFEDRDNLSKIVIDNTTYKIVSSFDNTLYLIGPSAIKNGKKVDITPYINKNSYINYQVIYNLNGKTINYTNI